VGRGGGVVGRGPRIGDSIGSGGVGGSYVSDSIGGGPVGLSIRHGGGFCRRGVACRRGRGRGRGLGRVEGVVGRDDGRVVRGLGGWLGGGLVGDGNRPHGRCSPLGGVRRDRRRLPRGVTLL